MERRKQGEESDGPFGGRERELALDWSGGIYGGKFDRWNPFSKFKKRKKNVKVEPVGLKY